MGLTIIPSLDLLDGSVVRLTRGDFATRREYGDVDSVLESLDVPPGSRLHVVDLAGSRDGRSHILDTIRALAKRGLLVQTGGGVRSADDALALLAAGASRIVAGTMVADDPGAFRDLVRRVGPRQVIAAVDVRDGRVRVAGWQRESSRSLEAVLRDIEEARVEEILVTDIGRDGMLSGPSLAFYRQLARITPLRVIASGGIGTLGDIAALARLPNVTSCVTGKALLDRRFTLREAAERAAAHDNVPERVIPCLDIRDGRVVKGVQFTAMRDAGDPVECARRYEEDGADELVVLDVSATDEGRAASLATVRRIAEALFIPLTVGGGVRSVEDFRNLLRAGADRVAINTAAVRRPQLIRDAAETFGVQAVVLSCDAKRDGTSFEVMVRSGKERTGLDAVTWCRTAEELGCGEVLLTSVDRDGTNEGFDNALVRDVAGAVRIGVIASGGAGRVEHFADAIDAGARATLAASLFHDARVTIGEVKSHLRSRGISVR